MRLDATIAGQTSAIDFRVEDSRVLAVIDGRRYDLAVQTTAGSYLIVWDGLVFDCRVEGRPKSGDAVDVFVGANRHVITLADPKRLRSAHSATGQADEAARIVAPMPGKVVRLLVEVGAHIEAGAGVAVVEAMKMQNEMKSPKAGTIVSINVVVGATVNGGDLLAVIE